VACVPRRLLQSMQWQHGGRSACRRPLPSSCSHWMLPGPLMPHVAGQKGCCPSYYATTRKHKPETHAICQILQQENGSC
jgi:hypothetical protein